MRKMAKNRQGFLKIDEKEAKTQELQQKHFK